LRDRLEKFGDPHVDGKWQTGEVDYVAELGLRAADVPELLAIARQWAEPMEWPDDEKYVAGYAPIHAWRGLAQLGAAEAIGPLLEMMKPLDDDDDDWYLSDFPHVFAWIGPASLAPLHDYLADPAHTTCPRATAADGLAQLAIRHPQMQDAAVGALCDALAKSKEEDKSLNGFIIANLLELKATEAAEVIERAFAADRVEVGVVGNWNMVRQELGVPGLGLVPEHLANLQWRWSREAPADSREEEDRLGDALFASDYDEPDPTSFPPPISPLQSSGKVGRNDPCPCGSGKKYKKCCGR